MTRAPAFAMALAAVLAGAVDAQPIDVRFIGNEAFALTDGDVTVLSDYPYRSGAFGYMRYDAATVRPEGRVVCLITHLHDDHFDPALLTDPTWTVVGPLADGIHVDNLWVDPHSDVLMGDLHVHAIETPHAGIPHFSYLMTWHGRGLYFTGDTESTEAVAQAEDLDVLFITPWLFRRARRAGISLDARRVFIYHQKAGETIDCEACTVMEQGERFLLGG